MAQKVNYFETFLSGGDPRSLANANRAVHLVLSRQELLQELFESLFSKNEIVRMRAGDALEKICRRRPEWFKPYKKRLFDEVSRIDQPSVQWHLAQMLGELQLDPSEEKQALAVLKKNLTKASDWIVTNMSLESFAKFARKDERVRREFQKLLGQHKNSNYKSVASRVKKLEKEFSFT
jgi:hypothetical protein